MNRRGFLTRSGLALGALLVGDEVLEAMERLTHRKVFALGAVPHKGPTATLYVRERWGSPWVRLDTAPVDANGITNFRTVIPPQYTEASICINVPVFTTAMNVNAYATLSV